MIKIICDRCGEELPHPLRAGYIMWGFRADGTGKLLQENPFKGLHFCAACMEEIRSFICEPKKEKPFEVEEEANVCPATDVTSTEEPEQQEQALEKKRRRRIDYGKLMALRKAGWSHKDIADEMGMTKAAVATAICTYLKKHPDR